MKRKVYKNLLFCKKTLFHFILLSIILNVCNIQKVQAETIAPTEDRIDFFIGNWGQSLELASFMKHPIFVYIVDESQTTLREHFENTVFTNKSITAIYNEQFINLKLKSNSLDAKILQKKHPLSTPAALLYFDEEGNFIKQLAGKQEVETLLEMADILLQNEAVTVDAVEKLSLGENTLHNFFADFLAMKRRHKDGDRDPSFLKSYAYALQEFNEPYNDVVYQYVKTAKQHLFSPQYGDFLLDFAENAKGVAFEYLVKHQDRWKDILGKERVEKKLRKALKTTVITAALKENPVDYEYALGELQRVDLSNASHVFAKVLKGLYRQYEQERIARNTVVNTAK